MDIHKNTTPKDSRKDETGRDGRFKTFLIRSKQALLDKINTIKGVVKFLLIIPLCFILFFLSLIVVWLVDEN